VTVRHPLAPHRHDVSSRAWSFYANVVAASPLLSGRSRAVLYRRLGIRTQTDDIAPACYFHSSGIDIGADTLINHGCHFENVAPVAIGADCALGMRCMIVTSTHEVGRRSRRSGAWGVLPVRVEDGCWIGAGTIILPGVTVGAGCVLAAGAVVREDCLPDGLYAGVPARRVRDLDPGER
jgi:maltose O-acetyltransferase